MSIYKASIYNYLFNSVNTIVVLINGIVMVPIYFHYMPVGVYGAWLASGNVVAMIGLLESGFAGVVTQKMAAAISQGNCDDYKKLAGSNIISAILFSVLILLIGGLISPFIAKIVNVNEGFENQIMMAFLLSLLSSSISVLVSLFGAFPQVWQQTKEVGIINTVTGLFGIAAMVIALIWGLGVVALGVGYLVRATLNFIGQSFWIWNYWRTNDKQGVVFDIRHTLALMKECIYPFLSRLTGVLMNNSQSLILARFLNPTLAAVYDITGKVVSCLCNFLSMANGSFFALLSLTFAKNDKGEIKGVVSTIMQYFSILLTIIIVYSMLFSKTVIYYWVGLDKYGGDLLLLLIILSLAINQYRAFYSNFLFCAGLIKRASQYDIASLVAYITILLGTIIYLQEYSIPVSLLFTGFIFAFVILKALSKHVGVKIKNIVKKAVVNVFIAIPFMTTYFVIRTDCSNIIVQLIVFVIATLLLILLVFAFNKNVYEQLKYKIKLL